MPTPWTWAWARDSISRFCPPSRRRSVGTTAASASAASMASWMPASWTGWGLTSMNTSCPSARAARIASWNRTVCRMLRYQ